MHDGVCHLWANLWICLRFCCGLSSPDILVLEGRELLPAWKGWVVTPKPFGLGVGVGCWL